MEYDPNNLADQVLPNTPKDCPKDDIKATRAKGYLTHDINGSGDNMCTADNICKMIEFLIHDRILISLLELSSSKVPSGGLLYNRILGRHT